MAESGVLLAPHVLEEKYSTPRGDWHCYVIAAPGYRLVQPVSSLLCGAGGFVFGLLAFIALAAGFGWTWSAWLIPLGIPLGVVYSRVCNRFTTNGRLIANGLAVRLHADHSTSRAVQVAASHGAPGYFELAKAAVAIDHKSEQLKELSARRRPGDSAERAVLAEELERETEAFAYLMSTDALERATGMLQPSDAAIDAAGHHAAVAFEELQEGRTHLDESDH